MTGPHVRWAEAWAAQYPEVAHCTTHVGSDKKDSSPFALNTRAERERERERRFDFCRCEWGIWHRRRRRRSRRWPRRRVPLRRSRRRWSTGPSPSSSSRYGTVSRPNPSWFLCPVLVFPPQMAPARSRLSWGFAVLV
jgi:hypothetical protein